MKSRLLITLAFFLLTSCAFILPPETKTTLGTDTQFWYQDSTLQNLLDVNTSSSLRTDNSVRLLVNGVSSFARRYENIRSATFIFVKTFLFTDDEAGREMARVLAERAQAGIPVVLQYDVKGSIESATVVVDMFAQSTPMLPFGEKRIIHEMRKAGVIIVPTNAPSRPYELTEWTENIERLFQNPVAALKRSGESLILYDYCDHEKFFITGHEGGEIRAIVGGMNIAGEYAFGGIPDRRDTVSAKAGWHDVDVEVRGPAAAEICEEFLKDMRNQTGRELPSILTEISNRYAAKPDSSYGEATVRFVVHHPLVDRSRSVEELYLILLKSTPAEEPIFIATAYFAPSKRIREAITEHAKRGGKVIVLTNSLESNNHPILSVAANFAALDIMEVTTNFQLYEWIPRPADGEETMHQKLASFGQNGPTIVGSFNLDAQSAVHNTESVVLINDPTFRDNIDVLTQYYLSPACSKRVHREDLETKPILNRIHSFLTHELAWYWL
ncbi:MAG: phosphatidylserine/phosphatidylglycerophosphate/cardiolipin synthase family protein [Candidatus Marinimicrobia bacterium]|nr:phosphatidylserine/phosphatidylglycerophosphate/cardiolipin synthase family protein [Candidatus Neomarinimicrobiota bacterium]